MMNLLKYKFKRAVVFVISLLISINCIAQNSTVEFYVNGLKVILKQTQKETLVMSMFFRGGSSNYTYANSGIESLALSGALECGTAKFSPADFDDQVDEYGLHLSGNAENDFGEINLSCISKYTTEAWRLFSSAISSPSFESQRFNLLKEQKINQLKGTLSDPDDRLKWLAQAYAFSGTPYSINPDGTVSNLQSLDRDAVKNYYYNTLLNKNRMFLVVAGNISKEDLEKKVSADLNNIPAKEYGPAVIEPSDFPVEKYKMERRNIATNYIAGLINAPTINDPNYPAFRVAVTILNSALYEYIRLNKQLSYAPSAYITDGRIPYVTMYASTTQPGETIKGMRMILNYMKTNTYSDRILENVRKDQVLTYAKRQEIMSEMVDKLGRAEIMGDWKLAETLPEKMKVVTAEDVRHVLNVYSKNITWAYIGDTEAGKAAFEQ